MAAIALMGSVIMGCSENDLVENTPQGKAVTLTTTISLDGSSATTRALDADGKKTFAAGEQIALIYESAENGAQKVIATLQATDISSDKKKATLTFALDKAPKAYGNFTMIYPACMAQDGPGEFDDISDPNYAALASQDGTLASLSSNLDLATCKSVFTSDATLPGGISLTNQLAILELTSITDYTGTNDLTSTITGLTVKVGDGASAPTYTVTRTAAAGPIYVAMQPCSESDITITATTNTSNYEKTVSPQSLTASTMTPVTAKMWKVVDLASQTSAYEAKNGEMLKGTLGKEVKISIAAGATVTLRNANINMNDDGSRKWTTGDYAGITCEGSATINLEGANKVHGFYSGYPGILAASNGSESDYTLTIKGDGSLEATGSSEAAGIGSGHDRQFCNIVIYSGTITATGGTRAAGIGSGFKSDVSSDDFPCGDITISGGTITAQGGNHGAGIGSGHQNQCGNINILDGTITAKGGDSGAGIGGGYEGRCGAITISGGEIIEAKGGDHGAGIGSGIIGTCGIINISGGTIESAKGGQNAAGIGSGEGIDVGGTYYYATCGDIKISGGTIKEVIGGYGGAGIGSGKDGICGDIKISGSTTLITSAQGGSGGAGIGSGSKTIDDSSIKCGDITISGGTIEEAKGGTGGAGIGSGYDGTCGDITITTDVTKVTATKGDNLSRSIGGGISGICGIVTIGCTLDEGGNPVDGTTGEISESPYTYQP